MSGSEHSPRSSHPRVLLVGLVAALVSTGCARDNVRPVITVGPQTIRYELQRTDLSAEGETNAEAAPSSAALDFALPRPDAGAPGGSASLLGAGPSQLDPGAGPIDLGYPLLLDLGAGDAPYDDGIQPLLAEERKRGGFSDSVVRVTWRERVAPNLSLLGSAAILREQDLSILDSLPDARFGFAVVGLELRW